MKNSNIVFLHHPNSKLTMDFDLIPDNVNVIHINVGINNSYPDGLRESADFFPSYACYNSTLFESSAILTVWEHADSLFVPGPVIISHTDVSPRFDFNYFLTVPSSDRFSIGTTIPSYIVDQYDDLIIDPSKFTYRLDPWHISEFDGHLDVWDLIEALDPEAADFALNNDPIMIYSHQFFVDRKTFDELGSQLHEIVMPMRLEQCGLWTAHVFERIIAIRLAMMNTPILTSMFSHLSSSGPKGPGGLTLYGPRAYKHFRMFSRRSKHGDYAC